MNRISRPTIRADTSLARASAIAVLAAAAIHAAAVPVHFDLDPLHGSLFAAVAVAQAVLGLALLVSGSRRVLIVSAAQSAGVVAAWVVSRTVGIPGIDVAAEREAVGLADGVATGLELLVVATALALVSVPQFRLTSRLSLPATAWLAIVTTGIVIFTVPAVAAAPHHDHADGHSHAVAAHHGGPAGQDLTAHNDSHGSNAVLFGEGHAQAPCSPSSEQQAAADQLQANNRRDLKRLADVETAKAEGYMRYGDVAIQGTWHYINWEYQADDDVLNTMRPESIIYYQATPDSKMYLIGAMYLVPGVDDVGPAVGGCLTTWHVHGEPFAAPGVVTPEMLHVWLIPMPEGPFS